MAGRTAAREQGDTPALTHACLLALCMSITKCRPAQCVAGVKGETCSCCESSIIDLHPRRKRKARLRRATDWCEKIFIQFLHRVYNPIHLSLGSGRCMITEIEVPGHTCTPRPQNQDQCSAREVALEPIGAIRTAP